MKIQPISEANMSMNTNDTLAFTNFNQMDLRDVAKFKTSERLMRYFTIQGMYTEQRGVVFDEGKLRNTNEKTKTVAVTKKAILSFSNIAHEGIKLKADYVAGQSLYKDKYSVSPTFQTLTGGTLVEAYFPRFDEDDLDEKGKFKEGWINMYKACLPREYRKEHRFTLLYRKYDPKRESTFINEKSEKFFDKYIDPSVDPTSIEEYKFMNDDLKMYRAATNENDKKTYKKSVEVDIQNDLYKMLDEQFVNGSHIFARVIEPAGPREQGMWFLNFLNPFL